MNREDFIFTIGYEGNTAVVDGSLKKRYRALSSHELAESGLFKPALCSAIYSGNKDELEAVLRIYNARAEVRIDSIYAFKRKFGVFEVPEGIGKVTVI